MTQKGALIRRGKYENNFLIVSRHTAEDRRLSFEARGLLFEILAKPPDWQVLIIDLVERSPAGRDKVYRLLNELIAYKYVVRESQRDESGRFGAPVYWVHGEPLDGELLDATLPRTEKPDSVYRDTVKPNPANPPLLSKHKTKNKHTTTSELELAVSWPQEISVSERNGILGLSKNMRVGVFRALFYELVDRRGEIDNPVAYFATLVKREKVGEFIPSKLASREAQQEKEQKNSERLKKIHEDSERQRLKQLKYYGSKK